ncbi:hypothetical protein F5X98DRAFT_126277 [Xylaria grammica]|nr:hypothetical protein F5X98DRAFT_126277 [Xylaria grammica]
MLVPTPAMLTVFFLFHFRTSISRSFIQTNGGFINLISQHPLLNTCSMKRKGFAHLPPRSLASSSLGHHPINLGLCPTTNQHNCHWEFIPSHSFEYFAASLSAAAPSFRACERSLQTTVPPLRRR